MKKLITITLLFGVAILGCLTSNIKTEPEQPSKRASRRSSLYAPPTIPHALEDREACLDCHEDNSTDAPMISHKIMDNCRQCHVPQAEVALFKENDWTGIQEPTSLPRPYQGAPPLTPHRVFMRENCQACHGVDSREDVINAPHPDRQNCQQCHVTQNKKVSLFRENTVIKDAIRE